APQFLPGWTAAELDPAQPFRPHLCEPLQLGAILSAASLPTAPVLREPVAFPARPGCGKSEVKRPALVWPRRPRPSCEVFSDRSVKRFPPRESKGGQFLARILKAKAFAAWPASRQHPPLLPLEVWPWARLLACEQQQSRARPVCALQFCCSSSLPLSFV